MLAFSVSGDAPSRVSSLISMGMPVDAYFSGNIALAIPGGSGNRI